MDAVTYYVYMGFACLSYVSLSVAFVVGLISWKNCITPLRILTVLLGVGCFVDTYAFYLLFSKITTNTLFLDLYTFVDFLLQCALLFTFGKNVFSSSYKYTLFTIVLLYSIFWMVSIYRQYLAPNLLPMTLYHRPVEALALVFLISGIILEYKRAKVLDINEPEFYIFIGYLIYYFILALLLISKMLLINYHKFTLIWVGHGVVALVKNYLLISSFFLYNRRWKSHYFSQASSLPYSS